MTFYKFGGSGGSQAVFLKGKDIAESFAAQGELLIEFRALFNKQEALFLTTQVWAEGFPIQFNALELAEGVGLQKQKTQIIGDNIFRPTEEGGGLLFRALGFLDDVQIIVEAGQYQLLKCIIRAGEFAPGRKLLTETAN